MTNINFNMKGNFMALKPGPKPIAKTTGEVDKRRREIKTRQVIILT